MFNTSFCNQGAEFIHVDYSTYSFMVIDDQPATRKSMQQCIQNMGGRHITYAGTYGDTIYRLRRSDVIPDIILCDYHLGGDRDGQQLLEELRKEKLITEKTIFMMITAERAYAQVVSMVELAPDDYLLKPFTPASLAVRLNRIVEKKAFFAEIIELNISGNYIAALEVLDKLEEDSKSKFYHYDLLRRRAETLLVAGLFDLARKQYQAITNVSPFPWAKAGLARTLNKMGLNQDALSEIVDVVTLSPNYFAAYDLRARIHTELGQYDEAQKTLSHAAKMTPKNFDRKMHLSNIAFLNGEQEFAHELLKDVMENNARTGMSGAAEKLAYLRLTLLGDTPREEGTTLPELTPAEEHPLTAEDRLSYAAFKTLLGDSAPMLAVRSMLLWDSNPLSATTGIDLLAAALHQGDDELAENITMKLLSLPETSKTFKVILKLFQKHGKEIMFRGFQRQAAELLVKRSQKRA